MSFALRILANILISVRPDILSSAVLFIHLPLAIVSLSVCILHLGMPLQLVINELSFEDASFLHENSLPMTLVVEKLPIIAALVGIVGLTSAIRHVILPLSLVFVSIFVEILAKAISHIIFQVSLVVTAI